jgi:molybdopterin synthase catalytic subunit
VSYDIRMATQCCAIDIQLQECPVQYLPFENFPDNGGGESIFLGRTRKEIHPQHGELKSLVYDAYRTMAVKVLKELADEAIKRFDCLAVRMHHALGDVPVGKASVVVQAITAHRAASFDACRFLIDELKLKAPIWKQEIWVKGTTWSQGHRVDPVSSSQWSLKAS